MDMEEQKKLADAFTKYMQLNGRFIAIYDDMYTNDILFTVERATEEYNKALAFIKSCYIENKKCNLIVIMLFIDNKLVKHYGRLPH